MEERHKNHASWWLLFTVIVSLIVELLLIFIRVEIVRYTGIEPNYLVGYDTITLDYASYHSDELLYYNYKANAPLLKTLRDSIVFSFSEGTLVNINLYGYYISFLRTIFGLNWVWIICFTGLLYNIIFIISLFYIFTRIIRIGHEKAFWLLLSIIFSPPYFQLISSWLRDLLIVDLLLLAFIFSVRNRFLLWISVTALQMIIRAYMVPLHVFLLFYFYSHEKNKSWEKSLRVKNFVIVAFLLTISVVVISQSGYSMFERAFPSRFVQNFTGLTTSMIRGKIVFKGGLYNFISDLEAISQCYYPFFYGLFYLYIIAVKFVLKRKLGVTVRTYFAAFLFVGIYIVVLHSSYIGFFISRILFITMLFAYLTIASIIKDVGKS